MPRAVDLVVFDLGGTTIRDRGEVPDAFAAALRDTGIAFQPAELAEWRGASKREVLRRLVARQGARPAAAERAHEAFVTALTSRLAAATDLAFADAAPAFGRLKAAGVRLAVNTGFDRDIIGLVLASVPWPADTFDAVVSADDVPSGRPAPDMILRSMERCGVGEAGRVAVVGDTRLDLEAGWRAGVAYRIGVLSGAHDRATLALAPHTHLVAGVSAVPDICLGNGPPAAPDVPEFGTRLPGVDYLPRPGGYVVVRNERGQVLVGITEEGVFLPGGGQDPGEDAAAAAVREAWEECAVRVRLGLPLGVADELVLMASDGRHYSKRCAFFAATIVRPDGDRTPEHEVAWLDPADADRRLRDGSQRWALARALTAPAPA